MDEIETNRDGGWLKNQRAASGLKASDFADALGIHRVTLWRHEASAKAVPNWLQLAAKAIAHGLTV